MDTPLRQRLVGALILVALGVVFWPIIFVQPDQFPALERRPVPPSPRVDNSPLPAPDSAGLRTSPAPAIADIAENADVDMPPEARQWYRTACTDCLWPLHAGSGTAGAGTGFRRHPHCVVAAGGDDEFPRQGKKTAR